MSIADAFAGIAIAFSDAGLGAYHPAVARWAGEPVFDDGGSIITPGTPVSIPCRAQIDIANLAIRQQEGYIDKDVALLVLASGLSRPIDTKAVIDVAEGAHKGAWSVQSAALDPMVTHYFCRGRRA